MEALGLRVGWLFCAANVRPIALCEAPLHDKRLDERWRPPAVNYRHRVVGVGYWAAALVRQEECLDELRRGAGYLRRARLLHAPRGTATGMGKEEWRRHRDTALGDHRWNWLGDRPDAKVTRTCGNEKPLQCGFRQRDVKSARGGRGYRLLDARCARLDLLLRCPPQLHDEGLEFVASEAFKAGKDALHRRRRKWALAIEDRLSLDGPVDNLTGSPPRLCALHFAAL